MSRAQNWLQRQSPAVQWGLPLALAVMGLASLRAGLAGLASALRTGSYENLIPNLFSLGVGLVLAGAGGYFLLTLRGLGELQVQASPLALPLGGEVEVAVRLVPHAALQVEQVVVRLTMREKSLYERPRTQTRRATGFEYATHTRHWAETVVAQNQAVLAGTPVEYRCPLRVPGEAMHSFTSSPLTVEWAAESEARRRGGASIFGQIPLLVRPEQVSAEGVAEPAPRATELPAESDPLAHLEAAEEQGAQEAARKEAVRAATGQRSLSVRLDTRGPVRLRDDLRGRFRVSSPEPLNCQGVSLSLCYQVRYPEHGRLGAAVGKCEWEAPELQQGGTFERDFSLRLPDQPISYQSRYYEVVWFLFAEVEIEWRPDGTKEIPLTVLPAWAPPNSDDFLGTAGCFGRFPQRADLRAPQRRPGHPGTVPSLKSFVQPSCTLR